MTDLIAIAATPLHTPQPTSRRRSSPPWRALVGPSNNSGYLPIRCIGVQARELGHHESEQATSAGRDPASVQRSASQDRSPVSRAIACAGAAAGPARAG